MKRYYKVHTGCIIPGSGANPETLQDVADVNEQEQRDIVSIEVRGHSSPFHFGQDVLLGSYDVQAAELPYLREDITRDHIRKTYIRSSTASQLEVEVEIKIESKK